MGICLKYLQGDSEGADTHRNGPPGERLLCASPCSKHFTFIISLNLHNNMKSGSLGKNSSLVWLSNKAYFLLEKPCVFIVESACLILSYMNIAGFIQPV